MSVFSWPKAMTAKPITRKAAVTILFILFRRHVSFGYFQKLRDLRVPKFPVVRSGELPKFMRHFFLEEQVAEIPIILKQEVFSSTIDIQERKRFYFFRSSSADQIKNIVRLSRVAAGRTKYSFDRSADRARNLFLGYGRGTQGTAKRACN